MINQRGFTLIELLLILAVIGILAGIAIPRISNVNDKAKDTAISRVASSIRTGMEVYHQEYKSYPNPSTVNNNWNKLDEELDYVDYTTEIDYNISDFTYITTGSGYQINVESDSTGKEYIITQDDFTEGTGD